jgi:hypothetical protein
VQPQLLQAFPFPSTLGEVTLHPLSQAGMFICSSCGKWAFPHLLWSFPPTASFTSFPSPGCWACAAAPAFSSQLVCLQPACLFTVHVGSGPSPLSCGVFLPGKLVYLQLCDGFPFLPSSALRAPRPLCYMSFLLLLLIIQFFSFIPGWGPVCPGGYADLAQGCLWEYNVPLSSPCGLHLPK